MDFSSEFPKEKNCVFTCSTCVLLTILAVSLSVATGVVVFFLKPREFIDCNCSTSIPDGQIIRLSDHTSHVNQSAGNSSVLYNNDCNTGSCSGNISAIIPKLSEETTDTVEHVSFRLTSDITPKLYQLEIKPEIYEADPKNFSFSGFEKISVLCLRNTKNFSLHIHDSVVLRNESFLLEDDQRCISTNLIITDYTRDSKRQMVTFYLNVELIARCEYSFSLNFSGPLMNDLRGLFYSSYEEKGKTEYLAASLFSPIDARKAFPCFDEPALKAQFHITLIRRPEYVTLSNMALATTRKRENGLLADIFEVSPYMPTYLVAFVVCKFAHKKAYTQSGVMVRVWAETKRLDEADFALHTAVKLLEFFEEYLEMPYTFKKLDLVAVPDYQVRGMENWGVITFRDRWLLYHPKYSSITDKTATVQVLAHEIAHLWFGDLVTPAWWSELWLKEGFAVFLEYHGINHLYPESNIWDQFVLIDAHQVFLADSLGSSHSVVQQAEEPTHIRMLFNFITYSKGATLMRMMSFMFGNTTYRSAVQLYLKRLMFKSATSEDLWSAIQDSLPGELSHINVTEIMNTWILQKNYPLVTVNRNGSSLFITQEKFRSDADLQNDKSVFGYRWEIPFTFTTSEDRDYGSKRITYLHRHDQVTEIGNLTVDFDDDSDSWIIANLQQNGYYRVNYDVANWQALIAQLKRDHTVIPVINRAQIINDAWNIAKAGRMDQLLALRTLEYLPKERDYVPWVAAANQLTIIDRILIRTSVYGQFQEFLQTSVSPLYRLFDWEGTISEPKALLRSKMIELACHFEISECVETAVTHYRAWMSGNLATFFRISPEIRSTVYKTGVKHGGWREWEYAFHQYQSTESLVEKDRLLTALSKSKEIWIINRFLEMTLKSEIIGKQDIVSTIGAISLNPIGRNLAWNFVSRNWKELENIFGAGSPYLSAIIIEITDSFNTETDYNQLLTFMMDNPEQATGSRSLMQAVEKTLANIRWLKLNVELICDWLKKQNIHNERNTGDE